MTIRGHGGRFCPIDGQHLIEDAVDPLGRHVVVDACALCDGMFLDKGELQALLGDKKLEKRLLKAAVDRDSPHKCPACDTTMDQEGARGVCLDVCLACGGVWLDGGELKQLEESTSRQGILERLLG